MANRDGLGDITANCMGLEQFPVKHGSASRPVPGYNLQVLDELANPVARRCNGENGTEVTFAAWLSTDTLEKRSGLYRCLSFRLRWLLHHLGRGLY